MKSIMSSIAAVALTAGAVWAEDPEYFTMADGLHMERDDRGGRGQIIFHFGARFVSFFMSLRFFAYSRFCRRFALVYFVFSVLSIGCHHQWLVGSVGGRPVGSVIYPARAVVRSRQACCGLNA